MLKGRGVDAALKETLAASRRGEEVADRRDLDGDGPTKRGGHRGCCRKDEGVAIDGKGKKERLRINKKKRVEVSNRRHRSLKRTFVPAAGNKKTPRWAERRKLSKRKEKVRQLLRYKEKSSYS